MKQGEQLTGFTIIEVMIVLAITGALLLVAILAVNGKQNTTEFIVAFQQAKLQINQTINEVNNGYYPATSATLEGSDIDHTFLGLALQFGVKGTDPEQIQQYTVIGNRLQNPGVANSPLASTYEQADTTLLVPAGTLAGAPLGTTQSLEDGLYTEAMYFTQHSGGSNVPIGAVAILSSLNASYSNGSLSSGTQQLFIVPLQGLAGNGLNQAVATDPPPDSGTYQAIVNDLNGSSAIPDSSADYFTGGGESPSSVVWCFASGTTNQSGSVYISNSGGGELLVQSNIHTGTTCGP